MSYIALGSKEVKSNFLPLFEKLASKGFLVDPEGKKFSGRRNLYEIRLRYKGSWRVLYAYNVGDEVILLAAFQKKRDRTPKIEIDKALRRLSKYI